MKLNAYQKFQLGLAGLVVGLFLDLWFTMQFDPTYTLPMALQSKFETLWAIMLLLTDPKELAAVIASFGPKSTVEIAADTTEKE